MIKAIFTALTGIDESIDSPENQTLWQLQRVIDELDIDDKSKSEDESESDA
jgi:hypothetical protein